MNQSTQTEIATCLPAYWHAERREDGSVVVTECDEPTFIVTAEAVTWAQPFEIISGLFKDEDIELREAWETEALRIEQKLIAIITQAK